MTDVMKIKQVNKVAVAWYQGGLIDWPCFEQHVEAVRQTVLNQYVEQNKLVSLPKVLNLCGDRYHFLVLFTASVLVGRTTVMPSNRSEGELNRLIKANNDIQLVDDAVIIEVIENSTSNLAAPKWRVNLIPNSLVVAELYTSGSTGNPVENPTTWGQLVNGAELVAERFSLNKYSQACVIATVPPQHMFGFEMSIMLPLVCNVTVHHGQPFYPLDIKAALAEIESPRILVTTPIHLKACNTLTESWPEIEFVISATATLSEPVALKAEKQMCTEVREVYGCSEVGAIATRRMTEDTNWQVFPDYSLAVENGLAQLQIPSRNCFISLPDKIEILDKHHLKLLGRNSDLIKIGGKRGSLTEITERLMAVAGVVDTVVFKMTQSDDQRERIAALVVAPGLKVEAIRKALMQELDQVFIPRPIYIVQKLPYNAIGKLTHNDLMASLDNYAKETAAC